MLEEQDVQKLIEAMKVVFPTKTDFESLKDEFGNLKIDFGALRGEFGDLKGDFRVLRGDLSDLKTDFSVLKGEFGDLRKGLIPAMEKVFYTKTEMDGKFDGIRKDFSDLQGSVDGYMKEVKTVREETDVISSKVTRHDRWIRYVAEKTKVELVS